MMKRKSTEHKEQVRFVQYIRTFHPELICFAIPNGADVNASQRVKLVHEGLLPGAPDLLIMGVNRPVLAIEFKRPDGKGKISEEQKQVHQQMEAVGVSVHTCHGYDEAKKVLATWMN